MKYVLRIIICTCFILFVLPWRCMAAEKNVITADTISVGSNSEVIVPINIKNNEGIIGFRITINYDASQINIVDVQKGTVTAKGMLNNNVNMEQGSFDVLWSNTEDVTEDGSLFNLVMKTNDNLSSDVVLEITYSQEDTFNENMEDVVLQCKDVTLTYDSETRDVELAEDYQSSANVTEYVENTICDIDEDKIIEIIDNSLKENEIENMETADNDAMLKMAEQVLAELEKQEISSDILTEDDIKIVAVKELYQAANDSVELNETKSIDVEKSVDKSNNSLSEKTNHKGIVIVVSISILLIIGIIILFIRKKVK